MWQSRQPTCLASDACANNAFVCLEFDGYSASTNSACVASHRPRAYKLPGLKEGIRP